MAFWHRAHLDRCFFQLLVPEWTRFTAGKVMVVWNCHADSQNWPLCISIVQVMNNSRNIQDKTTFFKIFWGSLRGFSVCDRTPALMTEQLPTSPSQCFPRSFLYLPLTLSLRFPIAVVIFVHDLGLYIPPRRDEEAMNTKARGDASCLGPLRIFFSPPPPPPFTPAFVHRKHENTISVGITEHGLQMTNVSQKGSELGQCNILIGQRALPPKKKRIGINVILVIVSKWNQFHWMVCKTFASTNAHLFALLCHFGLQ